MACLTCSFESLHVFVYIWMLGVIAEAGGTVSEFYAALRDSDELEPDGENDM